MVPTLLPVTYASILCMVTTCPDDTLRPPHLSPSKTSEVVLRQMLRFSVVVDWLFKGSVSAPTPWGGSEVLKRVSVLN